LAKFLASRSGLEFVVLTAAVLLAGLTVYVLALVLRHERNEVGPGIRLGAALSGLVAASAAVVPIIFTIALVDVFVMPKLTALRLVLVAGLVLFALGARPLRPSSAEPLLDRAILAALAAYVLLTVLATAASMDRDVSVSGQFEQYQGLLTILLFAGFFYLARLALTTRFRLALLVIFATLGAVLVSAYAIVQQLHMDPIWSVLDKGRPFSTLGQAEWLGAYLVLCLALGVALLSHGGPVWRLFVAAALGLILVAMLLTMTRGAYLGLVAAAIVLVAVLRPWRYATRRWLLAVPAGLVALGLVLAVPQLRQEAAAVESRALSTFDVNDGSVAIRVDLWRAAIVMTLDHPLLGTGPDTYPLAFPHYRDTVLASRRDFWLHYRPESPHNEYLAIAAGSGLPALVAYLALIAMVLARLARAAMRAASFGSRLTLAAVLAALVAYAVADAFMTADIAGSWLFWVLLGAGAGFADLASRIPDPGPT
jgi:O-antigen ligase